MDAEAEATFRRVLGDLAILDADHRALARTVQRSKARAATVEGTLARIAALSPQQVDLLTEATSAVGAGLYRSAFVATFASVVDALHQRIDRRGELAAVAAHRKWKLVTVEDLRDHGDFEVGEDAKLAGTISKPQMKSFHGMLHRRNQCAHPTGYSPTLDEALGFIEESLSLIEEFAK